MSVKVRDIVAFATPVVLALALACQGTYDNPCASLGGECVASETQCGGSLPYHCDVGICCVPNGNPAPSADAATTTPAVDAATTPLPATDASTAADTSTPPDTGAVGAPDTSPVVDTGAPVVEASTDSAPPADVVTTAPDTGVDAPVDTGVDAPVDTGVDANDAGSAADSGGDAGPGCALYAAPNTASMCMGCANHTPPVTPCQDNGCFGGYYCRTDTFSCVKPSAVTCP